jgi:hypoxanthine-guanine phosphoribosyltransferase
MAAAAARGHDQALATMAAADKEKVKMEKMKQFKELMMIDTSSYRKAKKAHHVKMLNFLSDEINGRDV